MGVVQAAVVSDFIRFGMGSQIQFIFHTLTRGALDNQVKFG